MVHASKFIKKYRILYTGIREETERKSADS